MRDRQTDRQTERRRRRKEEENERKKERQKERKAKSAQTRVPFNGLQLDTVTVGEKYIGGQES